MNLGEVKGMAKAPFPWFGGKSRAAELIWKRIGPDVGNYVEPFLGSAAVVLNRPKTYTGWMTLNDLDGNIANFWRSVQREPDAVALHACQPVNEIELHARHLWLVNNLPNLPARLMGDPDYCEPKTAGWWAWGCCQWIGSGWCSGNGAWGIGEDAEGLQVIVQKGIGGVTKQLPHLGDGAQGVTKQLPHLGDGGTGLTRQMPHLSGGEDRLAWLESWMGELSRLTFGARITCGDWERICSPGTMTRNGVCGVLLDPPYSTTGAVYAHDSSTVSGDVREWCKANGDNKNLRIVLCGYEGEGHEELQEIGWAVTEWKAKGGYQGSEDRERIWCSPHCLKEQFSLF